MNLEDVEYMSVIRFLLMKEKIQENVIVELKSIHADESSSRATIYTWFNYFQRGRTSVLVGKSPGMPIKIDEKLTECLKEKE